MKRYLFILVAIVIMIYVSVSGRNTEQKGTGKIQGISSTITIHPTEPVLPDSIHEEIRDTVSKFEGLMMNRDSDVLRMFSPPVSKAEQDEFMSIAGMDLFTPTTPRLFMTAGFAYKVLSYSLDEISTWSGELSATVSEKRSFYSNITVDWKEDEPKKFRFEFMRYGSNVYVDKYYPEGENAGKYLGLYPF